MQYSGGYAVQMCHTISTDVSHLQYGCVTSSVWICHIFSIVEGVQYGPVKSSVWKRLCSTRLPKTAQKYLVVVFILGK